MKNVFLTILISYFIGAIPVGYIIGRVFFKTDITKKGSGNIGFANVAQYLGLKAAFIVFLLDYAEGFFAVLIVKLLFGKPLLIAVAAITVVVGHDFSIFMKFKGGKGASTTYGALTILSPIATLFGAFTFFAILLAKKYISLSNIVSIFSIPIYMLILNINKYYVLSAFLLAILLIYTHRKNISDLKSGKEIKITDSNPLKKR